MMAPAISPARIAGQTSTLITVPPRCPLSGLDRRTRRGSRASSHAPRHPLPTRREGKLDRNVPLDRGRRLTAGVGGGVQAAHHPGRSRPPHPSPRQPTRLLSGEGSRARCPHAHRRRGTADRRPVTAGQRPARLSDVATSTWLSPFTTTDRRRAACSTSGQTLPGRGGESIHTGPGKDGAEIGRTKPVRLVPN
jgi:hypothetical protein